MIELLNDENPRVRYLASSSVFKNLEEKELTPEKQETLNTIRETLVGLLTADDKSVQINSAIMVTNYFGLDASQTALDVVRKNLSSGDPDVRQNVLMALELTGSKGMIPEIEDLLIKIKNSDNSFEAHLADRILKRQNR